MYQSLQPLEILSSLQTLASWTRPRLLQGGLDAPIGQSITLM